MPHIRKPSKIGLQSNTNDNGKLSNNAKKARVEKKISKVDQATQEKIIKFDGSEGNGKETGGISTSDGKKSDGSDTKPVCDKKSAYGKTSDGASKKIEGCVKGRSPKAVKETGNGNFKNTENASIFTENFSGKEKKVKFTEGWSSKQSEGYRKSFSGYLGGKSDKQKQFYSSYKSEAKDVLPLPQPSEVYVPQLGEIAVLTDLVPDDPISACLPCLEANGTYICTPCNPRCFIIQKVTTSPTGSVTAAGPSAPTTTSVALNPNADVFERSEESQSDEVIEQTTPDNLKPEEEGAEEDEGETPGSDSSSWTSNTAYLSGDSYAYMNGDVGKLPSGVVYTSTPDPLASSTDYSTLNGVADAVDHYETREGAGVGPIGPLVPSPPAGGAQDSNGIPLEQLKQMLLSQLEYYFSRENLANDAYLISQMDNDQYVPIWTVANFNQVKKLTTDIKLITEVLRESPNVQVDEEGQKVRPNHKRCIVILREIPDSTPLEDIKNLFSGEGCPRLISCEFAHNNSWYVTFESDEDAQRAYSFLREEVKVFQGKPIMARIKAKPMNRLPLPPVGGGGLGSMKNGYRTPPATYDPNAGPFQAPPPNPGAQQRFVYTNGSSIPPTVNYGNQVHVYTFQQPNQPFYPPTMLPWAAANNCYYDIGSVFSVNGLAPQQSFAKPANTRYVPRTRGNKRPQGSDRASLPDTGNTGLSRHHMTTGMSPAAIAMTAGAPVVKTVSNLNSTKVQPLSVVEQNHSKNQPHMHSSNVVQAHTESVESAMTSRLSESQDNVFRQNKDKPDANSSSFNADRHRRRRKDDDSASTTQSQQQNNLRTSSLSASVGGKQNLPASNSPQPGQSQGQFDLEATAFPPLPGIEAGTGTVVKAAPVEVTTPIDSNSQLHWGENRLADVVKGTAKPKPNSSIKEKDDSPRPSSPAQLPQAPPPAVKSVLTGTSAADVQEKPSRTAQASSQTSRAEQLTISTSNQAQQTASPTDPPTSKSDGKEIALSSCDASVATNSNILTPPPSPIKCVVPAAKCMTADKSTKTDDILLNGEPEKAENQVAALKPTTTNAATMTSSIAVETDFSVSNPSSSNGSQMDLPPRLSYAQVAQHHKEKAERMAKEKQGSETEKEKEKEKEKKKDVAFTREVREKKDSGEGFREVTSRSTGRGGARQSSASQGPRRREGAQSDRVPRTRELTSRQRSPK